MTKARMIELIKAQIESRKDPAQTDEERNFLLKVWPEMTDTEKDAYREAYAQEKGTLCNVVFSCNLEDLKATARTLERILTECADICERDTDEEGSIEETLHAVAWAIRAKERGADQPE